MQMEEPLEGFQHLKKPTPQCKKVWQNKENNNQKTKNNNERTGGKFQR